MSNNQVPANYLLTHAQRNVWCTPEQDKQAIIQPARVTPENGVWTHFTYQNRKILLPVSGSEARFHIYQVGQVHPAILGLVHKPNTWISAKEAMEQECSIVDVYTAKGIMIPRVLCWYIVTGDKNLLLAVRKAVERPLKVVDFDLEVDDVFVRLYSNAYFNSIRADFPNDCIKVKSARCHTITEINQFQIEIAALPSYGGAFFYVNGCRVDRIDLVNSKPGDYLEYVFDASIKREISLNVRNLQEFDSLLDDVHKYLLHYPGKSDQIDYQDDVDLYLGVSLAGDRWTGVYVHKNDSRTLRMVTHRDYSIPVIRLDGVQAANQFMLGGTMELRMTVRHSGYDRKVVFDNNRIFELYKLPESKILEAMVGVDSNVSVWEAGNLEASSYTKVMRQPQGGVTRELVQQAYGYNAMSVLLGDTPKQIELFNGQKQVTVPEGLRGCCTIYEYDDVGKLLYFEAHTIDNTYTCKSATASFVEVIYGIGGVALDIIDNSDSGVLNPTHNYRFYTAPGAAGIQLGPWEDRTGDPYYLITTDSYQWLMSAAPVNRVLSNKQHLAYAFQMAAIGGVFEFDLTMFKDGVYKKLDMQLGELDIFYNGYSLIEGLDFVVKDARVVVVTKKYFDPTLPMQNFTVRFTGFCNKDMGRTPAPDVGFVYHGNLSANNRFDIRDDKVLRIVCGGSVRQRSALDFAEDGISVNITSAENGMPYAIRDIIVPMNNYLTSGLLEDKTYQQRTESMAIDKEISDYLTIRLPETKLIAPNVIENSRYTLYSPFMSRIMDDLLTGVLWDNKFHEHFGDDWLRTRLAAYERLLDFDPIGDKMQIDSRYVTVHAHPYSYYVSVDRYQMRVLERAAKLYAPGVDVSIVTNLLQF
jgi:hypothetical protein